MKYGYARVSTKGQAKDGNSLEAQEIALQLLETHSCRRIKITMNTYGHLYPNQQKAVAELLNQKQ